MSIPDDCRYTKEHEWAREEDGLITVGVTDYAQEALGDLVLAELPQVGEFVTRDESFGFVESPKSANDLFCPVTGKVEEINEAAIEMPAIINSDPYADGWLIKVDVDNLEAAMSELMSPGEYAEYLSALDDEEL